MELLRLGHTLRTLHPMLHNGPGWRIGLWVQGCSLLCTDRCLNPHLLIPKGGHRYAVPEVARAVLRAAAESAEPVEGVSVLGGEPTDQAVPLSFLLRAVKQEGLTTMVYTGHTLEALRRRGGETIRTLLGEIDLLVDGPFVPKLYDATLAWRGSANQQIHCLTGKYSPEGLARAFQAQGKGYSISIRAGDVVAISGLQERDGAADIERQVGSFADGRQRSSRRG